MYPGRVVPFGADLVVKDWRQVSLERAENAPMQFVGSQITHHWCQLFDGQTVSITLWQHETFGFVVAFSTCTGSGLSQDCVAVDSLAEAISFVEDYCAHPPLPDPPAATLIQSLLRMHRAARFEQSFASVVGEALAAWIDLDIDHSPSALKHGVVT